MEKLIAIVAIIVMIIVLWNCLVWFFGGVYLEYLKDNGINKAREICDKDAEIIYEEYERHIFGGFGGGTWYLCELNNVPVQFYISRRINSPELQVYNIQQVFSIPTDIKISN